MASVMATLEREGTTKVAWTPEGLARAIEVGLLDLPARFEIIDGELYSKMGQSWPHRFAIDALSVAFAGLDPAEFYWSSQSPLSARPSYPEPDFHVLPGSMRSRTELPALTEAIFVVEVADSSLRFDTRVKCPLYASAGIPVFWLVDLTTGTVTVFENPTDGAFGQARTYKQGETLPKPFEAAPNVDVSDLIAPKSA